MLFNEDCLEGMKRIPDGSIDAIITDPPYGTTACKWDSIIPFEPMWAELKRIIKPNGAIVLFGSEPFSSALRMSNIKQYKYDWIWEKDNATGFLNSKKQPLRITENILVYYKKQCDYNPQFTKGKPYKAKTGDTRPTTYGKHKSLHIDSNGERYPKNLLYFNRDKDKQHPTQKPVALIEYLIKTYTNEGETVLDFTMGSGTTGVACKNTNREFIGFELDKGYYDIAVNRINNT